MEQTAVEWFWLNLTDDLIGDLAPEKILKIHELKEQAKAMEKEQKNQMYNETEVLQLLLKFHQTKSFDNLKEWFEQNKKIFKRNL